jgi:hypothetical protein
VTSDIEWLVLETFRENVLHTGTFEVRRELLVCYSPAQEESSSDDCRD